ncbi:MAG TPA: M23 family metallopeptidase [Kofleriaceae bacterium]
MRADRLVWLAAALIALPAVIALPARPVGADPALAAQPTRPGAPASPTITRAASAGHGASVALATAPMSSGAPASLAATPAAAAAAGSSAGPRDALARQLDDQIGSVDRALAVIGDKLAVAELARTRRVGAVVRLVRTAAGDDAAAARRRAAARLLLERDRGERALLVDELARLRAARARIDGELAQLPSIALPDALVRPAPGKIARHFGTLAHERSRTTLSRRGIDLEVEDHCPVVAPAAGTVRYAGPIRGLDQGVILDHGDYLTVIAKLGEVKLPVGAPVAAGDRLGRAARHRVYLELRVKLGPGGLPIDPEPLLARPEAPLARPEPLLPRPEAPLSRPEALLPRAATAPRR